MYVQGNQFGTLRASIRDEIELQDPVANGTRGMRARRVQEWLCLHGLGLVIDEDFGGITEGRVRQFQSRAGLPVTGIVDAATFAAMTAPMVGVLQPAAQATDSFSDAVTAMAQVHLAAHPVEIGGQNRGPWVRMYMNGEEGNAWPWCAGFVTFLMHQAAEIRDVSMPIKGSFSCDTLAAQAETAGLFVKERDARPQNLAPGSLFLVRRTSTDWTHVGLVSDADQGGFDTIEGNTNDEGSREGYEVCARRRGYSSKDFVVF